VQLVKCVQQILKDLSLEDIQNMWAFSVKKWVHTMRYGFV
jgi:hypothetical protein